MRSFGKTRQTASLPYTFRRGKMDEALNKNEALLHAEEVARGERFEFGKNWRRFLEGVRDEQIVTAESSLKRMLEIESLAGLSFLDIGSGSGLFSLAARRL